MKEGKEEDSILKDVEIMSREDRKHIGNAKTALYVVSGITVLGGILSSFRATPDFMLDIWIEVLIVAGVFLVLSMLAEKYTYQSLLIGLIIFLLYQLTYFIINPSTIFNGIIFKIAIVIYLSRGLIYALDVKKRKEILKN